MYLHIPTKFPSHLPSRLGSVGHKLSRTFLSRINIDASVSHLTVQVVTPLNTSAKPVDNCFDLIERMG
jgi:hypothetical protein